MARADRRRAAREARRVHHRPRAAAGGARIAEETMFFPKLRAHAKWVFVLLVVVFAGGFVFLGVGSGSTGLGDLLNGNISLFGGGGSSSHVARTATGSRRTRRTSPRTRISRRRCRPTARTTRRSPSSSGTAR